MRRSGHTLGPLFVDVDGELTAHPRRLGRRAVANVVDRALWYWMKEPLPEFSSTMLFPDFLRQYKLTLPDDQGRTPEAWAAPAARD